MERKTIRAAIKEAGEDGSFEAVVATFGVVDHDGDIIEHGAFGDQTMPVMPAHDAQHVPLGKARIEERGELAVAVGQFNMDIVAGREWSSALRFDLARPPAVQEWSWGFVTIKDEADTVDGVSVRRLIELDVREVSPVLRAASIGTGTLSAKRRKAERVSDIDLHERLEVALRDVEKDAEHLWVEAVFEGVVVYSAGSLDKPSRTFERAYTVEDDGVTVADEAVEVVRDVSYLAVGKGDAPDGVKLVDQVRIATFEAAAAVARVTDAVDARAKRGRQIGPDTKAAAITMAERCGELDRLMRTLRDMVGELMPSDNVARAAAKFLAADALRLGVDV